MAKKKSAEKVADVREADAGDVETAAAEISSAAEAESAGDDTIVEAATPAFTAEEATFLVAEVQAFLNKRSDLAERLAREIEATEHRLEELRRTAALLSPTVTSPAPEPAKPEKKAKKVSLKKVEKKAERKLQFAEDGGAVPEDVGAANGSTGDDATPAKSQADETLVA